MKRVVSLQHVWCENPGVFHEVLEADGHDLRTVRLDEADPLPSLDEFDGLLVMGGPMSVNQTDRYPWLIPECRLLADAIQADKPVLGICLGAQLIAQAAGAPVYRQRPKEIGLFDIALTEAGLADPLLGPLGSPVEVFQWHGETFDLPSGAVLLASSDRFEHQAFRLGANVYALQFHLECTEKIVADLCKIGVRELEHLPAEDRFEQFEEQLPSALARLNQMAAPFIRSWAGNMN